MVPVKLERVPKKKGGGRKGKGEARYERTLSLVNLLSISLHVEEVQIIFHMLRSNWWMCFLYIYFYISFFLHRFLCDGSKQSLFFSKRCLNQSCAYQSESICIKKRCSILMHNWDKNSFWLHWTNWFFALFFLHLTSDFYWFFSQLTLTI